jgi:hypothetical protein
MSRLPRAQVIIELAQAAEEKGLTFVGGAVIWRVEDDRIEKENGNDGWRVCEHRHERRVVGQA